MLNFINVSFCLICRFHSFDNDESCSQVVFSKGHTARNGRQTKRSVDTNFEICTVFYDRNQGLNQKTMTFIGSEYALSPKNPSSSIASIPEIFVFLWFKNYKGIYIFIRFATFNKKEHHKTTFLAKMACLLLNYGRREMSQKGLCN